MHSFENKSVLITGAASGIGKETAIAFARHHARLWICDLNVGGLDSVAAQIRELGAEVTTLSCDVTDYDAVQVMADEVHARIPALDILINNAGIGSAGRFLDTSLTTWNRVMNVNLMGVVHGCKAFLPAMVKRGTGGHVVNTASAAGFFATPDMPVYAASKFAVLGLSESLRADMREHGIGVTAVCPGLINTPIVANTIMEGAMNDGEVRSKMVGLYAKRNYTADRVARAIVQAVRKNTAVLPVSPEAWGMYLGKRLSPALMERVATKTAALAKG